MSKAPLFIAALLGIVAFGTPAVAAKQCGPRDNIVSHLSEKYGEARSGSGLGSATAIVEVWTSAKSGSWTILMTQANGTSCILAAGQDWHDVPRDLIVAGEPA